MRNIIKSTLLLLFLITFFTHCSCKEKKKRNEIEKIVKEWVGKEILFSENVPCYYAGKDTLLEVCNECFQKDFKILLYIDSVGCSSCRLQLFAWSLLIEEADSLFEDKLGFLLYFQPKSAREMTFIFKREQFDYPVFMDLNSTINKLNNFPKLPEYQCFLLDADNKVLMVGNPVLNTQIWELYKKQIK